MIVDIHSHLIPGIDDGAKSLEESLALFHQFQQQGVKRMVLTPHIHLGRYDNSKDDILACSAALQHELLSRNIFIEIAVAAEIRLDVEVLHLLSKKQIPFIGHVEGYDLVLLELPHSRVPHGTKNFVKMLKAKKIRCIIAHPERNRDIQGRISLIHELIDLGCYTQITGGSILGDFGEKAQNTAHKLLAQNKVDIVASDAHSLKRRPVKSRESYEAVESQYGSDMAERLFYTNPYRLTQSLFLC